MKEEIQHIVLLLLSMIGFSPRCEFNKKEQTELTEKCVYFYRLIIPPREETESIAFLRQDSLLDPTQTFRL